MSHVFFITLKWRAATVGKFDFHVKKRYNRCLIFLLVKTRHKENLFFSFLGKSIWTFQFSSMKVEWNAIRFTKWKVFKLLLICISTKANMYDTNEISKKYRNFHFLSLYDIYLSFLIIWNSILITKFILKFLNMPNFYYFILHDIFCF